MEGVVFGGEPKTPYLKPQAPEGGEEPDSDFLLGEGVGPMDFFYLDAGVGSPMDSSDEDYSESTPLSTIIELSKRDLNCQSPAPSLVSDACSDACSDTSLLAEHSMPSESEGSDGSFKMKKRVRFVESVEILPYALPRGAPRPKEPLKSLEPNYSEDIGVRYGLGRAGNPWSSSLLHLQQREFNTHRPTSPPTDYSDLEGEDGTILAGLKQRGNQYRQAQLSTVPLYPPPIRRATNTPEKPHHDLPPRVRSPGEMDMAGGYYYEDARYTLGQTSPTSPSSPISFSPPPAISFSPPLSPPPQPGDGVYRRESNFRNSSEYNSYSFHHPRPQRHNEVTKSYPYWKDGELRYEDQWGQRIYPGGNSGEFKLHLWSVQEDVMSEERNNGGKVAAVPGGRMTLREQRLRARGMRR